MANNDLVISVGANIRELERQMKASAQLAAQKADEIEREFARRNPKFGGAALAFGLGAVGGAAAVVAANLDRVGEAIVAANKEIASFAQTSRQAGIELERFQQLRFAAGSEGISGKAFDAGVQGLAKELNEARREETELGKFLEANNVKIKDRRGEVLSTNQALSVAADLISRAATEQDKIAIAEKFKLPAEFVPLLENGAAALDQLALKASEAGAVLSRDVIEKAEGFDKAWNSAWNTFTTYAKAAIAEVSNDVGKLFQMLFEFRQRMINAGKLGAQMGEMMSNEIQGKTKPAPSPGTPTTAPYPPSRPGRGYIGTDATRFAASGKGGGGGSGGGKSEEEQRTEQVQRYIEALERTNRVLAAEEATLGRSKAERAAAIELARIGTVTDEAQKQKIIEIVGANERYRESIERTKQSQKDLNEAQKYFGSAAVDALEDLIVNGAKAEDVMKRLIASLAKAALQAALLGEGPLGSISGIRNARSVQ